VTGKALPWAFSLGRWEKPNRDARDVRPWLANPTVTTMLHGGHTAMYELGEIWQFLPEDEAPEPEVPLSAEEAAVHVGAPAEWGRLLEDVGRRDVMTADEVTLALRVADDEDDGRPHRQPERELDVGELLERQHYAFAPAREEAEW
jgi:hypothetical protein